MMSFASLVRDVGGGGLCVGEPLHIIYLGGIELASRPAAHRFPNPAWRGAVELRLRNENEGTTTKARPRASR